MTNVMDGLKLFQEKEMLWKHTYEPQERMREIKTPMHRTGRIGFSTNWNACKRNRMRSDQPAGICIPEAFITRLYRRKRNMEEFEFEQELLALHDKLFGYACKLFSEKEEAEDLLQETFLKALANKNKYNENSNFKGWMYTIMHNTYLNICQDKQHTQRNSLSDDKIFMEVNNEEGLLICNEYDLEEIHKIISKLPEGFSSILTMRLAGFKYHEIAQEFNIPVSLVKNRIFCAKKKLKEMLKDFYDN